MAYERGDGDIGRAVSCRADRRGRLGLPVAGDPVLHVPAYDGSAGLRDVPLKAGSIVSGELVAGHGVAYFFFPKYFSYFSNGASPSSWGTILMSHFEFPSISNGP